MLYILFFIVSVIGVYFLLLAFFNVPTRKMENAMVSASKYSNNSFDLEDIILKWSISLSSMIKLPVDRKERIESDLMMAGIAMSAEVYLARTYLTMAILAVCVIISLIVSNFTKLAYVFAIFFAVAIPLMYTTYSGNLQIQVKNHRAAIDRELPSFVSIIQQELKNSKDIVAILEHYQSIAGEAIYGEITRTLADARTSNPEIALIRMDTRIGSPALSQIVRGLIGVIRGNDSSFYFETLSHEMLEMDKQRLATEAASKPKEVSKYIAAVVFTFLLYGIVVLFIFLMGQVSIMF